MASATSCPYCPKNFDSIMELALHIDSDHPGKSGHGKMDEDVAQKILAGVLEWANCPPDLMDETVGLTAEGDEDSVHVRWSCHVVMSMEQFNKIVHDAQS